MPSLHLRGLSYAHTTATPILADLDLDLDLDAGTGTDRPWVGVVGANGAGKTTLLRLLSGGLTPTTGTVHVEAPTPPRLVPQDVTGLTADVRAFGWAWDGVAERLRRRLALDPDDLDPDVGRGWPALSPGQRKRWQIAAALWEEPDVLLLDEPTNHLDAGARALLMDVLDDFTGLGLLVSHDRVVLERLTSRTLRLHRGVVELHAGAYEQASTRWRQAEAAERERHDRARREVRRERRLLADARRNRHSAQAKPRRERRLAGANQPDAREAVRKFAQQQAEASLARRVGQQHARLQRAEDAEAAFDLRRDLGAAVGFRHVTTGRRVLAEVAGDLTHAGGEVWLHDVAVTLYRDDRVRLAGDNGAGKTTLLRAVLEVLAGTDEAVATLPQELPDLGEEVSRVRALEPAARGRVLGAVATLGVDPEQILTTDAPSPGEARKLALAGLLVADASVLVLDEPTNHLDLPSIERLQQALVGWPGALLMITHDDVLAGATTTTTWHVGEGTVDVDGG